MKYRLRGYNCLQTERFYENLSKDILLVVSDFFLCYLLLFCRKTV